MRSFKELQAGLPPSIMDDCHPSQGLGRILVPMRIEKNFLTELMTKTLIEPADMLCVLRDDKLTSIICRLTRYRAKPTYFDKYLMLHILQKDFYSS